MSDITTRYKCPRCGSDDQLLVNVTVHSKARLYQDIDGEFETELLSEDHEWDGDSTMQCLTCKCEKTARDFDSWAFTYYINLDERGEFNADVRNWQGRTVFEIPDAQSLTSLIDDGFMTGKDDLVGLHAYLSERGYFESASCTLTSEA